MSETPSSGILCTTVPSFTSLRSASAAFFMQNLAISSAPSVLVAVYSLILLLFEKKINTIRFCLLNLNSSASFRQDIFDQIFLSVLQK